jgi:putative phage-type endonuclease
MTDCTMPLTASTYRDLPSLGGSDVGAILGVSRYKTAAQVWDRIMGMRSEESPDSLRDARLERGTIMEPVAADLYARRTGARLHDPQGEVVVHPELDFLHARLDREIIVCPDTFPGDLIGRGALEIKVLGKWTYEQTRRDGVHPEYYAQLQHQIFVRGLEWGAFAIFNADAWDFVDPLSLVVRRDEDHLANTVPRLKEWWQRHVVEGVRPPATSLDQPSFPPAVVGGEVQNWSDDEAWNQACLALKHAEDHFKLAEHAKKLAQDRVKALMGEHEVVEGAVGRVNWKESQRRNFKKDDYQRDNPNIDLTPWMETVTVRTFKPTWAR